MAVTLSVCPRINVRYRTSSGSWKPLPLPLPRPLGAPASQGHSCFTKSLQPASWWVHSAPMALVLISLPSDSRAKQIKLWQACKLGACVFTLVAPVGPSSIPATSAVSLKHIFSVAWITISTIGPSSLQATSSRRHKVTFVHSYLVGRTDYSIWSICKVHMTNIAALYCGHCITEDSRSIFCTTPQATIVWYSNTGLMWDCMPDLAHQNTIRIIRANRCTARSPVAHRLPYYTFINPTFIFYRHRQHCASVPAISMNLHHAQCTIHLSYASKEEVFRERKSLQH